MNRFRVAILIVLGIAGQLPTMSTQGDQPDDVPMTLENAKAVGRLKSNLLQSTDEDVTKAQAIPTANVGFFHESIAAVLKAKCQACHGPEDSNANLRVDKLNPNLLTGPDVERWREIYKVLSNSEMPPADEPDFELSDEDRSKIVNWLGDEIQKAAIARRNESVRSSFRRMTKYEYQYALQDVLGLPYSLDNALPPESASEDGFKNRSDLLQMSAMQFQTYRQLGLKALKQVTVSGERPQPVTYVISMQQEMEKLTSNDKAKTFRSTDDSYEGNRRRPHLFDQKTGVGISFSNNLTPKPIQDPTAVAYSSDSTVVLSMPRSNQLKLNLDRFLPDDGMMRVRIKAARSSMNPDEFAGLRLIFSAHTSNNANFSNVISPRDLPVTASADKPEFIDFHIPLGEIQRNPFRKLETRFPRRDEFLTIRNESSIRNSKEPLSVLISSIEITAPHYDTWPPKSHTDIFFPSKSRDDEQTYGREVLAKFMRRAWRRPVSSHELDPFMDLFAEYRSDFDCLEDAMIEVLATVLATPEFLYVTQQADSHAKGRQKINDVELASRLSFFLWSSVPDEELIDLAERGQLSNSKTLKAQVERMLADDRARRFSQNFVQQWLGLDGLESVTHVTDEALKSAMLEEPKAFFREVLHSNSSVMDFLHADYIVANERLAGHYHIPYVYGPHFRRVPVTLQSNRGGLLTAAAIATMNSDGEDSHPLKRGIWLLEHILHDPPPPPPPDVPEVDLTDPRILEMTLKERIADHRNKAACISCHAKIDPWGIAFENYNALGVFRTKIKNEPVDATSALFNKQELAGMEGLKRYLLLDRQDQFAAAIVHKMTAYALGRSLSFGDSADIDSLTARFRKSGDRLGDLIHLIAGSDIFQSK